MPKRRVRRSLSRRENMLQMLQSGMTFQEVGDHYGLSRQRVHAITGPIGRRNTWRQEFNDAELRQILQLAAKGLPYAEISAITGRSLETVSKKARQAGIHRKSGSPPSQTPEKILEAAVRWESRYGEWPKTSHWRKSGAQVNPELLRRYTESKPPEYKTVIKNFDSFQAMIEEAKKLKRRMKRRKK